MTATLVAEPTTTTEPAETATRAPEPRTPMVGPISADASTTAVLSWVASLASLATTGAPTSVDLVMPITTVTITLPGLSAYREWCTLLACPHGFADDDQLGGLARTRTTIGGWHVVLACHVEVPRWLA